jgi:polysaccharide deacetylase family protein (PEP-CTERM system associated)
MMNGLSFDVGNAVFDRQTGKMYAVAAIDVENSIELLLALLRKNDCLATFFVLGSFASRWPRLVKKIVAGGHEIASQGYSNEPLSRLTRYVFRKSMVRAKEVLEDIAGRSVLGYRAPGFSLCRDCLWAIDILKELDFKYDSSISAAAIPEGFCVSNGTKGFFTFDNGIKEFPLASYKLFRMNFMLSGASYFNRAPHLITRLLLQLINGNGKEFVYCYHPSELGRSEHEISLKRQYRQLCRAEVKLQRLLSDFRFQPLKEFLLSDVYDETLPSVRLRMQPVVGV